MVVKRLVVLTLLMMVLAMAQASAAKRVALVIGNSAYRYIRLIEKASKKILTQYLIEARYSEPGVWAPVNPSEVGRFESMVINRFVTLVVRKLKQEN